MGEHVRVAAIVLAAGRSSRMGEHKLLLPLGGRPLVTYAVDAVSARLTTSELQLLIGRVSLAGDPARLVAAQWLKDQGLT